MRGLKKFSELWYQCVDGISEWLEAPRELQRVRRKLNEAQISIDHFVIDINSRAKYEDDLRGRLEALEKELAQQRELMGPPGLSAAQIERLALLAEELGEAQQCVGKVLRHGWQSQSPFGGPTNRVALERELGDVFAAVDLLRDAGDVCKGDIYAHRHHKRQAVGQWLHHQEIGR